ncbi:MAG: type I 3-dehydroquinate dehydratase, partial [Treponemataceae bacterium]|nr:type I 3-dehydroquinate dehydratase [Treponemataceae bacterium]
MAYPLICLTLTGRTLQENVETVRKYASCIDIAELRVDYLDEAEQFSARRFPAMIPVPCVLTIRRREDGGKFEGTEFSRTTLFARSLAYADLNPSKNFAYVDFEEDFHVPNLQDAALAFGIRIIRSCHDFRNPVVNVRERCKRMCSTRFEIPKIAFMPKTLSDVTRLFAEAAEMTEFDHILCAMGNLGVPSRILAGRLHSYLTYASPPDMDENLAGVGHLDPVTLNDLYNFRNINEKTELCAVTGFPLKVTSSPLIHNSGYRFHNMNRLFIPLASTSIAESLEFADLLGIRGMAVTVPFKEDVLEHLESVDAQVGEIGACNTIVRENGVWVGRNTDA